MLRTLGKVGNMKKKKTHEVIWWGTAREVTVQAGAGVMWVIQEEMWRILVTAVATWKVRMMLQMVQMKWRIGVLELQLTDRVVVPQPVEVDKAS